MSNGPHERDTQRKLGARQGCTQCCTFAKGGQKNFYYPPLHMRCVAGFSTLEEPVSKCQTLIDMLDYEASSVTHTAVAYTTCRKIAQVAACPRASRITCNYIAAGGGSIKDAAQQPHGCPSKQRTNQCTLLSSFECTAPTAAADTQSGRAVRNPAHHTSRA